MIGPLAGHAVSQVGFVFQSLDDAIADFGGTWRTIDVRPDMFREVEDYRGRTVLDHSVALSEGGPPQLELIQPNGSPNIWQDWLDDGKAGIHHCAVEVASALAVVDAMERAGFPSVLKGRFGLDGEFAYFDAVAACGLYVEALTFPTRWAR